MEWVMIGTGQGFEFTRFQNNVNECLKQGWTVKDIKTSAAGDKDFIEYIVVVVLEKKQE